MMGNRPAIDRDERRLAPRRLLVDGDRRQLLAGARFARHEHRRIGIGYLADGAEQLLHRLAGAHHRIAHTVGRAGLGGRLALAEAHHAVGVADQVTDHRASERALHVVEAALVDQLAHLGLGQARGIDEGDPADLLVAQERFQRGEVAGLEAVHVDDAGVRGGGVFQLARVVRGAGAQHLPLLFPEVGHQGRVGKARQVDARARGLGLHLLARSRAGFRRGRSPENRGNNIVWFLHIALVE